MPDYPNDFQQFSWFVSQFADAVEKGSYDKGFWFGRLLSFGYKFNFSDTEYKEYQIRQLLDDTNNNYFTEFNVSNIQYVPYADNPNYFIASAKVKIVGRFDGNDIDGEYVIEHRIQRTWEAVYSKVSKRQLEENIMQDEEKNNSEESFATDDLEFLRLRAAFTPHASDMREFGYFGSQYYAALKRWHHDSGTDIADNGFWFGKMTTPRFELKNWDGVTSKPGKAFWESLRTSGYIFPAFTIDRIAYVETTPPGSNFRTATATVQGTISFKKPTDIQATTIPFESVHKIRQIWAADDTNYLPVL